MVPPKNFWCSIFLLSLFSDFGRFVQGRAGGGPTTPETCLSMTPKHGVGPQADPSPYTVHSSKTEVRPGEVVELQIRSSKEKIKGFYVQGRKEDFLEETMPVGSFIPETDFEKYVKIVSCGGGRDNTITHTSNVPKEHVKFAWKAPMEPGTYVIVCTIAKNGSVFWVYQASVKITVT